MHYRTYLPTGAPPIKFKAIAQSQIDCPPQCPETCFTTPKLTMCQRVRAEFRCSDWHESRGDERTRVKHFARCTAAIMSGQLCPPANQEDVHVLQEDEPDENCPECKGDTPPETP